MSGGFQYDGLQCEVQFIGLDFKNKTVTLMVTDGECSDMSGTIALAMAIWPGFDRIFTMSGTNPDTAYFKIGDDWEPRRWNGLQYAAPRPLGGTSVH